MHHASCNRRFAPCQLDSLRHSKRPRNWHRREVRNGHAVYLHRQAFRPQPFPMARRAFCGRHVVHQPIAVTLRRRLFQILFQISEDAVESAARAASGFTIEQEVLDLLGKFFKRSAQVDPVRARHHVQLMNQALRRRSRPQAAIQQGLRPVADHLRGIEIVLAAQPVTLRASSVHAVERERTRFEQRHVNAAIRARQFLRIQLLFAIDHRHLH